VSLGDQGKEILDTQHAQLLGRHFLVPRTSPDGVPMRIGADYDTT
jgi:hypothetical protein